MSGRRAGRAGVAAGMIGMVLTAAVWAQAPGPAAERGAPDGLVILPELDALRQAALSRRPSVTARAVRMKLFRQVEILTAEHLRLARGAAVRIETEPVLEDWLARYGLPARLLPQERAVAAGILLQIDLLDEVLAARAPRQAETVRAARRLRKVRSESELIFFDRRDVAFFTCSETLSDLHKLHAALLGETPPAAPDLAGIKTWRDAEEHLVVRMEQLAETARRIP